jgi:hypothetical protein
MKNNRKTTFSKHWMHKYPNLTGDMPTAPNQLWVSDITYLENSQNYNKKGLYDYNPSFCNFVRVKSIPDRLSPGRACLVEFSEWLGDRAGDQQNATIWHVFTEPVLVRLCNILEFVTFTHQHEVAKFPIILKINLKDYYQNDY